MKVKVKRTRTGANIIITTATREERLQLDQMILTLTASLLSESGANVAPAAPDANEEADPGA